MKDELKTLKDLATEGKYFDKEARLVSEEEIKKELGIKWIKNIENEWTKIQENNKGETLALSYGPETSSNIGIEKRRIELNAMVFILKKILDIPKKDLE